MVLICHTLVPFYFHCKKACLLGRKEKVCAPEMKLRCQSTNPRKHVDFVQARYPVNVLSKKLLNHL